MRAFFLGLRIRIKLLSAFGSLLILSVLLILFSIQSINRIIYHKGINEQVDILKFHTEALDLACREFMYEGYRSTSFLKRQETSSILKFKDNYRQAKAIIQTINGNPLAQNTVNANSNHELVFSLC